MARNFEKHQHILNRWDLNCRKTSSCSSYETPEACTNVADCNFWIRQLTFNIAAVVQILKGGAELDIKSEDDIKEIRGANRKANELFDLRKRWQRVAGDLGGNVNYTSLSETAGSMNVVSSVLPNGKKYLYFGKALGLPEAPKGEMDAKRSHACAYEGEQRLPVFEPEVLPAIEPPTNEKKDLINEVREDVLALLDRL